MLKPAGKEIKDLIWGIALVAMGIAFFFRIDTVLQRLSQNNYCSSDSFFTRTALIILAVLLVGGGLRKIYNVVHQYKDSDVTS